MFTFNNENIITGYIKQLLHSFNLPTCPVVDKTDDVEKDTFAIVKNYDNKGSWIVYKNNNTIEPRRQYVFGKYYPNLTTTLTLSNNIYDTYTHEYLGKYLRFIRDFLGFDLMSLYNCYSNNLKFDDKYKYIIIPTILNKTYTVAINCRNFVCKFVDATDITAEKISSIFDDVTPKTTRFDQPIIINNNDTGKLNLVIRVSKSDTNPIIVLEGNYSKLGNHSNMIQANYDSTLSDSKYDKVDVDKLITSNLSLLCKSVSRQSESPAFADRLIEYLCDMVITPSDKISQNIIDAKQKLYNINAKAAEQGNLPKAYTSRDRYTFSNIDRLRMLDAYSKKSLKKQHTHDLLGYVDKDIEQVLDLGGGN